MRLRNVPVGLLWSVTVTKTSRVTHDISCRRRKWSNKPVYHWSYQNNGGSTVILFRCGSSKAKWNGFSTYMFLDGLLVKINSTGSSTSGDNDHNKSMFMWNNEQALKTSIDKQKGQASEFLYANGRDLVSQDRNQTNKWAITEMPLLFNQLHRLSSYDLIIYRLQTFQYCKPRVGCVSVKKKCF